MFNVSAMVQTHRQSCIPSTIHCYSPWCPLVCAREERRHCVGMQPLPLDAPQAMARNSHVQVKAHDEMQKVINSRPSEDSVPLQTLHDSLAAAPNLPGLRARNLEGTEPPLLGQCQQYCLHYPLGRTKRRQHYAVGSHSVKPSVPATAGVLQPARHKNQVRCTVGLHKHS